MFEKLANLFLQILSFNFNISYYDFETDQDYQDNQLILVITFSWKADEEIYHFFSQILFRKDP